MDLGIAGRGAIVCASSKGLGRACAMELARAGCRVVVNGRDAIRLEATAAEIRAATGAEVIAVAGDLGDARVREVLLEACPTPDILVNNNGGPPRAEFEKITREQILNGIEANMLTPIALIQRVAPGMAERRIRPNHQHHFGLGARADRRPRRFLRRARGPDRVSRQRGAALRQATTSRSIRSSRACSTPTGFARRQRGHPGGAEAALAARAATVPARRLGSPAEFGALCAFLASAHAGYITGQNVLIDGGVFPGAF